MKSCSSGVDMASKAGERLREERTRLGLKQEDMAAAGGVNRNTQGSYERGGRNPDTAYLAAVAGLGIDVYYIVTGTRLPESLGALSADDAQLLKRYRSISADDQKAIRRFLQAMADDAAKSSK